MVSSKLRAGNFDTFRCLNLVCRWEDGLNARWIGRPTKKDNLKQADDKEMDFVLILML